MKRITAAMMLSLAALSPSACDVFLDDLGELGEPCSSMGDCYDALQCIHGTCSETPSFGEDCDPDFSPADEACTDGNFCVDGVCAEAGGPGQPCIDDWALECPMMCDEGAYCVNDVCVAMGGEGEPCWCYDWYDCPGACDDDASGGTHCDDGLECVDGTCTGPSPETVDQPDSSNVWLRCPIGMTWDGWRCTGTATEMTWAAAKAACPSGYSLATRQHFMEVLGDCPDDMLTYDTDEGPCAECGESDTCTSMFTEDLTGDETLPDFVTIRRDHYWTRDGPIGSSIYFAYHVDLSSGYVWPEDDDSIDSRHALCVAD